MKFAPIIDPAVRKPAPKPVRVDLRKAFGMGTGLWAVALVIALILLAFNHSTLPLVIMCAAGVIIANKRAAGVTVGSYKTSAGAVMHLPIAQVPNIARALDDLKDAGFWVAGASEHAQDVCWDSPLQGRVALVMGSEGDGISRLVLEKCDFLTKLPQRGLTESLNVAQAACALCFEWMRRNASELGE